MFPAGQPWVVRVWERESGALHALGEHAPGLLGKLAWQPNGRNLYAACRQPDGALRVLLFESNGLQHGGFDVPGKGVLPSLASPLLLPFHLPITLTCLVHPSARASVLAGL